MQRLFLHYNRALPVLNLDPQSYASKQNGLSGVCKRMLTSEIAPCAWHISVYLELSLRMLLVLWMQHVQPVSA